MRKTSVLLLTLAFGLALAGSELWIGPSAQFHYDIPNPEPGVFPKGPGVFTSVVDTFKYDDGMPGSAWAWNEAGNGWGMKFISPGDNITLAGALLHFYSGWPDPGGDRALVKVFADDGANGAPNSLLWESDTLTIVRGQWNYVPIDEQIIGSNYYIFYVQVDDNPNCPGFSIDAFNNAPSGYKWTYTAGAFAEDARRGEWLIRSVVDWDPQDVNASALYFASNMPIDTTPGINFFIRTFIKNLGNDPLPVGTPVKLRIAGPRSYVHEGQVLTTTVLNRGQQQQVNFTPLWNIPSVSGLYTIRCWTEADGEQYPGNDTIVYNLSVAQWIEYYDPDGLNWLTWQAPERAVKFDPSGFGLQYPVGLGRARHTFYLHPQYVWPDTSFRFHVYADDGFTLLYESDEIEARPGSPGPATTFDFDSLLIFESGEFYIAVVPSHFSGHPSSSGDGTHQSRSFTGSPGGWTPWTLGEFFTSASVQGGVGLSEGDRRYVGEPRLSLDGYPNPVADFVTVRWNLPRRQAVEVNLYDATGRLAQNLYSARGGPLNGAVQLDTRELPAGIYLLRLEASDGSVTRKLVLQ